MRALQITLLLVFTGCAAEATRPSAAGGDASPRYSSLCDPRGNEGKSLGELASLSVDYAEGVSNVMSMHFRAPTCLPEPFPFERFAHALGFRPREERVEPVGPSEITQYSHKLLRSYRLLYHGVPVVHHYYTVHRNLDCAVTLVIGNMPRKLELPVVPDLLESVAWVSAAAHDRRDPAREPRVPGILSIAAARTIAPMDWRLVWFYALPRRANFYAAWVAIDAHDGSLVSYANDGPVQ